MQSELQANSTASTSFITTFLQPLRTSRSFTLLFLGQVLSLLGSSVTSVILPVVVYALTGSTVAMGMTMTAYMLPLVLILPFSGWIVDRLDRIKIMLLTDIIRVILNVATMVLLLTDSISMPALYAMMAVNGLMNGLFQPAYSAVRAVVFSPEIRNASNALTQIGNQGVRLLGPALGGLIVSSVSAGVGFGLSATTYFISFVCLWFLRTLIVKKQPIPSSAPTKFTFKEDFIEGIRILKSHPWLWITIVVFCLYNVCHHGIITILIPWLFNVHFQLDAKLYGFAVTASGIGALVAGVIFGSRPKWRKRGYIAYGGIILASTITFILPFVPSAWGLIALMLLEGFGVMWFGLIWETSLQELVPEEAFGRVVSIDLLGSFALLPVGYLLVGWLADAVGGVPTMVGLATFAILLIGSALMVPGIRKFD